MGSPTQAAAHGITHAGPRRVRHGVRDGLAVMAFSAASSAALAAMFLLLARVAVGVGN